jgi:phage tail-like protein
MMAGPAQPFTNVRFRIEIEGLEGSGAYEVMLPQARIDTAPRKTAKVIYGTLILRRGLSRSSAWYDWWQGGRGARRNVRVVLLDDTGADAVAWVMAAAKPVAYHVSRLHALESEPMIESLELTVGGFAASFPQARSTGHKRR